MSIRFWGQWLEKHATGYFWIMPDDPETIIQQGSKEYEIIKDIIQNNSSGTGFALPRKMSVNLSFPSNQVAFKESVDHHNLSIAKALLVPNLLGVSTQSSSGSFAQANTQLEAFLWTLDHDAGRLQECINEELIRELGDINFGDGIYPNFVFSPISDSKKLEVINNWKELVSAKAVSTTDSDENHLRSLLDFPEVASERLTKIDAEHSATMMAILNEYRSGKVDEATTIKLLVATMPFNEDEAIEIIKDIEVKEVQPQADLEPLPIKPTDETDRNGDNEQDQLAPNKDETEYEQTPRSTSRTEIISEAMQNMMKAAFKNAQRRCDFQKIEHDADAIVADEVINLAGIFNNELGKIVQVIKDKNLGTENSNIDDINNLKMNRTKFRNGVDAMLRRSWLMGTNSAESELSRTSLKATKIDFSRLGDKADDFLKARGFSIAGKFTDDALATIKNLLFQGVKSGKSNKEITDSIYITFAKQGNITPEMAMEALGKLLKVENPTARLNTLVRTTSFEAMNEARYDLFTDPDLDDFIVAFKYSAILDSRTSEICNELHGNVYKAGSELIEIYRPPNHMNCRSLLVPMIEGDDFELQKKGPRAQPQDGFA
jgi:SPP1 gp7 family putative phage head morphogenesis protein